MVSSKKGPALFIGMVFSMVVFLTACGDELGDRYISFAQCLNEKGAVMYGAYWCPHCATQKKLFGKQAFEKINYVECDPRGENGNPKLCLEKKIDGYPTWDFVDGSRAEGVIELSELAAKTGCSLPVEVDSADERSSGASDSETASS